MYDELVKRLRELHPEEFGDAWDFAFACQQAMREAADAIENMSEAYEKLSRHMDDLAALMPRWIPVTERLPECDLGAEVGNIEWISCGMVNAGCFGRGGKYRDAYFRTWTDAGEGMDAKNADYWRAVTLPEPPEEVNDGN